MKVRLFFYIALILLFFPPWSQLMAAPMPATSSSAFIAADKGVFRSKDGFSISAGLSDWVLTKAPKGNKFIAIQYKSPHPIKGVQAALTVRVDPVKRASNLKKYVKNWIKDYPKLGFDILSAKKIKVNNKPAFLLDLINKESDKQLRQVVFLKRKKAIILTCRDQRQRFLKTLKTCNNIIRSFKWL